MHLAAQYGHYSHRYTPLGDPNVIEAFRARDLANGAVASWAGMKGVGTAAQGTSGSRPTKAASSFNGQPGVTGDGVDDFLTITGVGATIDPLSQLVVVAGMLDTTTAPQIPIRYGGGFEFEVVVNDTGGAGNLELLADGAGATWKFGAESLATPQVMTFVADRSVGAGVVSIYHGLSQISLTLHGGGGTPGGTFSNASFTIFADSGDALPWAGTFSTFVIANGGLSASDLQRIQRWVGLEGGIAL